MNDFHFSDPVAMDTEVIVSGEADSDGFTCNLCKISYGSQQVCVKIE